MNELKCPECGTSILSNMTECPNCGYPVSLKEVDESQNESTTLRSIASSKNMQTQKAYTIPYVSLVIGIIILIIGICMVIIHPETNTYVAKTFSVDNAAFGADFYTEIYGATDIIVDELNAINGGIESLSASINAFANLFYSSVGILIIAIGLSTIAFSFLHIKKKD